MDDKNTTSTAKPDAERDERESGNDTDGPEGSSTTKVGGADGPSDTALLEAQRSQSGSLKDLTRPIEDSRAGAAAVAAARDGQRLADAEKTSALDWFLNEEPKAMEEETLTKELNFGTQDEPRWVSWTIKPVPMEVMRAIRKKAGNTRAARQTGEVDEYRVNLEIVVEGTVDPDLRSAARQLHEEGRGPADPVDALRAKFASKPGYITQLGAAIMTLSGFNDEDVRDAEKAAKN